MCVNNSMSDVIVYQVRVIDAMNNMRIVHAYETNEAAEKAIEVMRKRAPGRYAIFPVVNQPDQYWGINFPPPAPAMPAAKRKPPIGIKELPKVAPKAS